LKLWGSGMDFLEEHKRGKGLLDGEGPRTNKVIPIFGTSRKKKEKKNTGIANSCLLQRRGKVKGELSM